MIDSSSKSDISAKTLGQYFKKFRGEKKVSLNDVAEKTRVNIGFLKALEADQWDQFPDETITRGFIKSYSKFLGMDEEEVWVRYQQLDRPVAQEKEKTELQLRAGLFHLKHWKTGSSGGKWIKVAVIIGLILVVQFIATSVKDVENSPSILQEPGAPPPVLREEVLIGPEKTESVEPVQGVNPSREVELEAIPSVQEASALPVVPAEIVLLPEEQAPLDLFIDAREWSWVAVRIDNNPQMEVTLKPGDNVHWQAKEQFSLDLGNAGGVEIIFNGLPLETFGPSGAVIKNILLVRE